MSIQHPQGGRFEGYGKPKRTPTHPKYAAAVVIKENGRDRLIRFGLQGANRFPKRKGESKAAAETRKNWKARHAQNIKRGSGSKAYWANKFLW
tara:strand:- start:404 stop:682 length:279 start_codon:yes stop_codon:yes gene_type:complete